MDSYIKLSVAALLPVAASVFLFLLDRKTAFGKLHKTVKQIIYGVIFGLLAVIGTEWGIPMNGAQVNCRDAAVLTAGLMFGAPAGILAGLIGGIERWVAVAWGVGTFTQVACSVSTIIAGFYSAVLRKYMFEDKKPGTFISLAIGIVMEIFHLTMVFITNMATPEKAMSVVEACTAPMVIANGVSVMLAAFFLTLLARDRHAEKKERQTHISQTIQSWLLVTVVLAFAVTSFFVFRLQDELAISQENSLLDLALDETAADISDLSDDNLLSLAHIVAKEVNGVTDLAPIAEKHNVAEIDLIDMKGIIFNSTNPDFKGFDMHSGEQAAEFLCLLNDTNEYVQEYGPISYDPSLMRKYGGVKTEYGMLQVGYDAEQFQKEIGSKMVNLTKNRHVGETGFVFILDEKGNIVSMPEGYIGPILATEYHSAEKFGENINFPLTLYSIDCVCRYRSCEGYTIVSVLPEEEALKSRNVALYVNSFMEILVFAVLFGLIYMLIKKVVVNQIQSVNESLSKITGGNLDEVVNVRSNAEFASLSDDINSTVDTLKSYIAEASARIDAELEFAKNIQASALPNVFPAFPKRKDFDIFASMNPAKEVGGDFYDFYLTGTDTLHFLIADVSGKGIPAAMFMMRAKTELKSLTESGTPINEVFTTGNRALCEGNDAGMFVTAWQGGIDLTNGLVQFVNAGHNPPLIRRKGGKFEYLRSKVGFVLAGMDGFPYKTQEIQLEPGDMIYLYTDGVTEATNANTELFGEERLLAAINDHEFENMEALCHFVKGKVDEFVGEAPQFDDITMVALKFIGTPPPPSVHYDECAIADIPAITEFVESELEKVDFPMKSLIQINIAIDEIYSNIVKYGYPTEKKGPATVKLIIKDDPRVVFVRFEDAGIPYNPLRYEDPDITLPADQRGVGGLGIYMVKKTMDDVRYKYEGGCNILTIKKSF